MALRAFGFLGITSILLVPYALASVMLRPAKRPIAALWFRGCRFLCGLKLRVSGAPESAPGTLFASNHVSYLDIIVLGERLDGRFVAKSDVANWPLFGLLSRMAETVFVTRDRRFAAGDSRRMEQLIRDGERLILFPEGTSSDGRDVLPFMSSLFAATDPRRALPGTMIQPVTIIYADYADGRSLRGSLAELYAWYGDMTMFGHLIRLFGLRGATVEVTFHRPLEPASFPDRKGLAQACETAVRDGLAPAPGR